ncbi:MAG TPA: CopG family transcriptional regulator [Planctomycetota bacterium]|nr:CopG family transcriptional regulator [Planctomycetota bacterium]
MRERMSIAIDGKLRRAAQKEARRRGISVSQLVSDAVARHLGPVPPPKRCTARDLVELVNRLPPIDPDFAADVRRGVEMQGEPPGDPWAT